MIDVAVDTTVFIASLLEKDHFHEDAISFLEQINTKQCRAHISKIVLVEIAGAISRRIDEASAREAIEIMGSWITEGKVKTYDLNKMRMLRASEIAMKLKVKGMDAIVLQIADELKIPFKSYDEEVKKKIEHVFEVL